jgi:hypothetical protein
MSSSASPKRVWIVTTLFLCGEPWMSPKSLCAWDTTIRILRQLRPSHSLLPHIDHVEGSEAVSLVLATHHGDDQYFDATWLRWVTFSQVANLPTPPADGCARQGSVPLPATAIVDPSRWSRRCRLQSFAHRKVDPGCPLPGAGYCSSPIARHPPKASRDSPVAIQRVQLGVMQGTLTPIKAQITA